MEADNVAMPMFVQDMIGIAGRPVLDRTGLTKTYNFTLDFAPEVGGGKAGGPAEKTEVSAAPQDGPSIFTALQEQLGLKLEATRAPVEVFVIDRVERPTEN